MTRTKWDLYRRQANVNKPDVGKISLPTKKKPFTLMERLEQQINVRRHYYVTVEKMNEEQAEIAAFRWVSDQYKKSAV